MSKIIINIPIQLDKTYPIKSNVDPEWIFTDIIIYSAGNIISVVCFENNCEYVAKRITLDYQYDEPGCYTNDDKVRNELVISKHMSEIGVGPRIYDMSMNDIEAIMIMDKYDGSLADLMWSYQSDRTIPMAKVLDDVALLLEKMHSVNICHGDLHMGNIFYTKSGKVVIGDFDQSLYTASKEFKEEDWISFEGIRAVYDDINQGSVFTDRVDFTTASIYYLVEDPYYFNFLWNGRSCSWG